MKLNIRNRLLMLLHWLCSLMVCVAFALCIIVPGLRDQLIQKAEGALGVVGAKVAGIALLALYAALCVAQLCLIVRRKKRAERGFISVDSNDKGKVRIAVSAIEQMVRQSVRTIDGITEMKVDIEGLDDAIAISVKTVVQSGVHVPTITANMQRAITQFVEVNCGVAVQSVEITINAVSGKGGSPRRLLGRNKPQGELPTPAFGQDAIETESWSDASGGAQDASDVAPGAVWNGAPVADAEPAPEERAPAFDLDKPYESEFAKDLAAMKAREAAAAPDADDGE